MTPNLSRNTQAILLVTAPLIAGRGTSSSDLLSPGEYKHLARRLRELQRQPADLLSPSAADLIHACQPAVDENRLQRLLGRGFLLSQVVERWQSRAIWVVSRADTNYPRRLKARLREDAPAVLYGCGDESLLETGGLAVAGSRDATDTLIAYAHKVGDLAASAGKTIVSGGARGIDQAAMIGALEQGGKVVGILADSLEKGVMKRETRNVLVTGQMALISPYDPSAGFHVGNAMQRNKVIYALADASLVVSSDLSKGGTWAGAAEQLDKLHMVPVYVRSSGEPSLGLDALRLKGATPWPDPKDVNEFNEVFNAPMPGTVQAGLPLLSNDMPAELPFNVLSGLEPHAESAPKAVTRSPQLMPIVEEASALALPAGTQVVLGPGEQGGHSEGVQALGETGSGPANVVLAAVREALQQILIAPMREIEVAEALNISAAQAKIWLKRFVDEGILEKRKRPSLYVSKQSRLFE